MNDIFKWKTGPIQLLIHLIGNEFFSGSFTHFAFCEYSVIATFSDVCVLATTDSKKEFLLINLGLKLVTSGCLGRVFGAALILVCGMF